MKKRVAILGGGIAGLTTAIALQNIGIDAVVFEAAPIIREVGAGIGLGANAIKAFKHLGIADEVMKAGHFLPSFTIYNQTGKVITKTDSAEVSEKYGLDNFTIHRADLLLLLLSKINPAFVQTNKRLTHFTQQGSRIIIHFTDDSVFETDYLIAAEGIHSVVRRQLVPASKVRYSGYTCWRGVIDNSNLQLNESSETWAKQGRFGIVPLRNNKLYWFACINAPENDAAMSQWKAADLLQRFKDYHQPIPNILAHTKDENIIWGDIIDLIPLRQFAFDNILLIGDAAHATTPNLGQGACQAIEDAVILSMEMKAQTDVAIAFINFEQRRLKRTHWITNTSQRIGKIAQLENSVLAGMRDLLFSALPKSFNDQQFKKLYHTDF